MRRSAIALALSLLLLAGCASVEKSPDPAPVVVPPEKAPPTPDAQGRPSEAEAKALAQAGKWAESARVWEALATASPTAENWNEAAFAWLQADDAAKALAAGRQALALNKEHPYALYNMGLAELAASNPCGAVVSLDAAFRLQPDRWEPALALAKALALAGNKSAAPLRLARAIELGAPAAEVEPVQNWVAIAAAPPSVDELTRLGEPAGVAAGTAIYHWVNPGHPCKVGAANEYWAVTNGQAVLLSAALSQIDQMALLTTLPDGDQIFALRGGPAPNYVSAALSFYVVRLGAEQATLIQYDGDWQRFHQALSSRTTLYGTNFPVLSGTELKMSHRNPASGKSTINLTWQVDWATNVATLIKLDEDLRDPNK